MTNEVSTAADLVAVVQSLGVELKPDPRGDRILFRPKEALPPDLFAQLRERKQEVLAFLDRSDPEVWWRVRSFRTQIPTRGAIGFLAARPDTLQRDAPGCCWSCGDPVSPGLRWFCHPCQRAKYLAVNQAREGLEQEQAPPTNGGA